MNINPMKDLPMGFGMALMQNKQALQCFSELPEDKKQQILNQTHSIFSWASFFRAFTYNF